jgi:alpha-L-rhamnosidase
VLGKKTDARKYLNVFEKAKAAFLKRYVSPEGLIAPMTQTAGVLALYFDLLPDALRPKVIEWLVRDIESRGGKTTCGFVGSSYQPHVLTEYGQLGTAQKLLFQKGWPSYLYAVTMGATTIWERWDGWTSEKGFQDAGMNSFNHYAYGAVGSWLYEKVAGLDTDEHHPGYKHLILRPRILDGLNNAKATLDTPYGPAESAWEKKKKALVWKVTVPPNTTARAYIPALPGQKVTEGSKAIEKAEGVGIIGHGHTHHDPAHEGLIVELVSGTYVFEVK